MAPGFFPFGKEPGALDHIVDSQSLPRQRRRTFPHRQTLDLLAIHDQQVVLRRALAALLAVNFLLRPPLRRIVLHQVGEIVRRNEIVHRHDLDLFSQKPLVTDCPKHQASDPPKAVNANFDHDIVFP
jgi:hypothetical protein